MSDDIYVRLSRPEGYEDVHPDLVLEDAQIDPVFGAVVVTEEIERLRAEAERQYDQAVEVTGRALRAEQERDEARALLREVGDAQCQHGPTADTRMLVVPDELVRRIARLLGGRDASS